MRSDYEANLAKLNAQKMEIDRQIKSQLAECPLDELLPKTSAMLEKANAKIVEYGILINKTFSPLPELRHDTSLSIAEQKSQLIEQYIEGMNKVATISVAIKTKIERDEAMARYQAMKSQTRVQRTSQASGSAATAPVEKETEEKKSGPGI